MNNYAFLPSLGTARVATGTSHVLAEAPTWDPIRGRILWVDIMEGAVHSGRFAFGGGIEPVERIDFPDTAGTVAVSLDGDLVVAGTHRLYFRDVGGVVTSGPQLIEGSGRRFNDGKPDPRGQLVLGTKGPGDEVLIRVNADGGITLFDDDLTLSNGLTWASDGRRLFTVDTLSKRVYVRDYDSATGTTGPRSIFTQIEHGYPDGMTLDAQDHLWLAVWGEGCVLRIDPAGQIVARVDVPAPHTTCAIFAGPELDTLVITTATEDLSPEQAQNYPLSGRLFTIKPGVAGAIPHLWSGVR